MQDVAKEIVYLCNTLEKRQLKNIMGKLESVIGIIKVWPDSELVNAWNILCDNTDKKDKRIENMESFNEMLQHLSPSEVQEKIRGCEFGTMDDYFAFDKDGNIESFSEIADYSCFSYYELAEYISERSYTMATELDYDTLLDDFICEYFGEYDEDEMRVIISSYKEDTPLDLLKDDWDELGGNIRIYIEEVMAMNGVEEDDEDNDDEDVNDFINRLLQEEAEKGQ